MSTLRIRVARDTPVSGEFRWARLDAPPGTPAAGSANLAEPGVTGPCELVLAGDLVLLERVAVPRSQQKRLGESLRYLAEEMALQEPERLHVAAAPGPNRDSLCLGVIERQWLQQLLARLQRAGLVAESAYPETLLPALAPRTWTVVWGGNESFVRTGEHDASMLDLAEAGAAPTALRLALEQARARGDAPQALVVRCAPEVATPDLAAWSQSLDLPVEDGPAWHWSSAQPRPAFELLQGEFQSRRGAGAWVQRLRAAAVLAIALGAINSVALALDWHAKARERDALLAQMRGLYRETFGEGAVVVDAPLQMQRALAQLRERSGRAGPSDFVTLASIAAGVLPPASQRQLERIAYDAGTLTLTLRSAAGQPPTALPAVLRARGAPPGYEVRIEPPGSSGTLTVRLKAGGSP
ncbi:MAG TPA: type II secretion system protein GspL [Burkholderiales bacterium]|nr:type II secretion system protein GspL [Burkholderiales bacterium]